MRVTAIDQIQLHGTLTEITLTWNGEPPRRGLPVGFNQGNHLRAQRDGAVAWLAGTVPLPDAQPDVARVTKAVERLLREHDALRACFTLDEFPTQGVFEPCQVSARPRVVGRVWHNFVEVLLRRRCHAGGVPGLFFGILDNTLICAFDHAHTDALTIDLVLRRLLEYYADIVAPARPTLDFTDRCIVEASGGSVFPEQSGSSDLMRLWKDFFAITENALPAFPLDLGVGKAPQRTVVTPILDDAECLDALGSAAFATILAALAGAVADLGGPRRLATLIPIHTRGPRTSSWHDTAGWMVSNAPVVVAADDPVSATHWLDHAAALADLPLDRVLTECRPHFTTESIFMVSYLDYRKLGPSLPGAQHISAVTSTDTAQFWFTRSEFGLELRTRYPARPEADAVITRLLASVTGRLRRSLPTPLLATG